MKLQELLIEGTPVTFATRREKEWKSVLVARIPPSPAGGNETGMFLRFVLPTLAPQGQPLDVDNLCEPVFVVTVRHAGWFGRSKPRILWWSATKEAGPAIGCSLTISSAAAPSVPSGEPTYREIYQGVFPKRATSPEVAAWAAGVVRRSPQAPPATCIVRLEFGSGRINIGDISTGVVKSFVDCLYPFFGGRPGAPEDHRISHLIVQKGVSDLPADAARVTLWYEGRAATQSVVVPTAQVDVARKESPTVHNPCRPGSAKWIVCEGALRGKLVADVRAELDRLKPGSGARLSEYISDVRGENNMDVKIEGAKLACHGQVRK